MAAIGNDRNSAGRAVRSETCVRVVAVCKVHTGMNRNDHGGSLFDSESNLRRWSLVDSHRQQSLLRWLTSPIVDYACLETIEIGVVAR